MLFGDHFSRVSDKAKLYYIKLMFYAFNGFVSNPLSVLDSMGYDKSVLEELVANEDVLRLPDRCEIFITSYFVHTHFKPMSWLSTPFSVYWKGKLFIKKNGVATFKPQIEEPTDKIPMDDEVPNIIPSNETPIIKPKRKLPKGMTEDTTFQEWYGVDNWGQLTPKQQEEWKKIWTE